MTLVRWNPKSLDREIDSLVRNFWGDVSTHNRGGWYPSVDITEHEDHYELTAELPGISREDVTVQVKDGTLLIEGEKKRSAEHNDNNVRRTERSFGSFSRSFRLDERVNPEKIRAAFKDGVLSLTVPKAEEVKPKSIDIKVS